MSVPPEVLEILRVWVRKADHDLEAARRIMAENADCPYDTVCFHCQQAVEKYLKALLTYSGVQIIRTHDLEEIFRLIPRQSRPDLDLAQLVILNPYAVEIRYADDWREPEREEAELAFAIARDVAYKIRKLLPAAAL